MDLINPNFIFTEQHVNQYKKQGFVKLEGIFSNELIDYLTARMNDELDVPTDPYQNGFEKLRYDLCNSDKMIFDLISNQLFKDILLQISGENMFFTQGVGFNLKKNVGTGFCWHIEEQSFGFNRANDNSTSLWIPLTPIECERQGGGMRYVPRDKICGKYFYDFISPAVFEMMAEKIDGDGIAFDDYVALRDEPLNSSGINRLLDHFSVEDDFKVGDALFFDKYVIHRSAILREGELESRDAFTLRFISETSRYDKLRSHNVEMPRNYYGYDGPTKFHLDVCKEDGELIIDSELFESDREKRVIRAA